MKRKGLAVALLSGLLFACGGNSASLVGTWVEPIPGMEGVQGIQLEEAGKASSINMATLPFESWKQENDKLILKGKSIGNGVTSDITDTLTILKVTADSLIVERQGMTINYSKQK